MTTDLYLILKRRCGLIDGYGFNGARLTREEQYLIGLLPKAPKSNGQLEKLLAHVDERGIEAALRLRGVKWLVRLGDEMLEASA